MFENRVPLKLLGPKRDEVTADWTKLHLEELNDIYSSPVFQVSVTLAGYVARMGRREMDIRELEL